MESTMKTANNLKGKADGNSLQLNASVKSHVPKTFSHNETNSYQLLKTFKRLNFVDQFKFSYTETNICQLNDNCLLDIFKHLNFVDQFNLARSSNRFHHAFSLYFRLNCKEFDINSYKFVRLRNEEQKVLLSLVGAQLKVITAALEKGNNTVELLCTFCPNVSTLNLWDITGTELNQFINSMQMITTLHLYGPGNCNIVDLDILTLKKLSQLKKLTVRSDAISGKYFSELKKLEFLELSGCNSLESNYLIEILKAHVDLRTLNISRCGGINENVCQQMVQSSTNLESLEISPRGLGCEIIARLPSLKYLTLFFVTTMYFLPKWIFSEMVNHATQLVQLNLVGDSFVYDLPNMWGCLKNLAVLNLYIYYKEIRDEWLMCFNQMENLQKLTIIADRLKINDGLLNLLTNCKRLSHVEIKSCVIYQKNFVHRMISILRNITSGRTLPVTLILVTDNKLTTDAEYDKAVENGIINIICKRSS